MMSFETQSMASGRRARKRRKNDAGEDQRRAGFPDHAQQGADIAQGGQPIAPGEFDRPAGRMRTLA